MAPVLTPGLKECGSVQPPQGSPQAALSPLSPGQAAHLFNGWQAPERPSAWAQGQHTPLSYPCPRHELRKDLLAIFPTKGGGEEYVELQVLVRCLSLLALGSGPGCQECVPKPSSRSVSTSSPETRALARVRARSARTLPSGAVTLCAPAFPSQLCLHWRLSSHHQAEERKPRWRPFQACKWDPKRPPP